MNDSWFHSALKSQPRKTNPRPRTMETVPIAAPRRIRSWAPIEPRSTARLSKNFAPPSVCRKSLKSFTEPIRSTSRVLNSMIDFTCCRRSHPLTTVHTIKAIVPKTLGTMTTSLPMLVSPVCEENNGWRVEWLTACGERLASHREGLRPLPRGRLGRRRRAAAGSIAMRMVRRRAADVLYLSSSSSPSPTTETKPNMWSFKKCPRFMQTTR